jgi:hypothetical protein
MRDWWAAMVSPGNAAGAKSQQCCPDPIVLLKPVVGDLKPHSCRVAAARGNGDTADALQT